MPKFNIHKNFTQTPCVFSYDNCYLLRCQLEEYCRDKAKNEIDVFETTLRMFESALSVDGTTIMTFPGTETKITDPEGLKSGTYSECIDDYHKKCRAIDSPDFVLLVTKLNL